MANPICYGDTVFIELDETLLFSNGFFDPNVRFVSKENISLKAFRFGLFKIYPNLSYKDVSQVDQLKDQLDLLKSLNPGAEVAYTELENDLKKEEKSLEERDAKLDLLNEKIMQETLGRPIKYGQKIQLFHIESQSFLGPSKIPNEVDSAITNLELVSTGNKNVYFRFAPNLGFIQEGESVEYNIPLQVVCIKTETPLIKGEEIDLTQIDTDLNCASNMLLNDANQFAKIEPRRKQPLYQQEKVFFSGVKQLDTPQNTYVRKYLSFQDHSELKKKKAFTNGDYVRICNDKVYLTIFPERNSELVCFQSYGANQEQSYSSIYTLFQIIEAPEEEQHSSKSQKDKVQKFSSSHLPSGALLEYQENKKYVLKHFVSGKILGCDKGVLKLESRDDANQTIEKISVIMKNKSKETAGTRYIDRNSIMQLKFIGHAGESQGILGIGKGIKTPTEFLNTQWFFGYPMTDDYLNKSLRTERFTPKIRPAVDDKSSSFKFTKVSADENTAILLVESLANKTAKFLDFLNLFLQREDVTLKELVVQIKQLLFGFGKFERQMYEEAYNEAEKDVLTPNKMVQTLLREFRVFDMFYRIFFYMIKDGGLLQKVIKLREQASSGLGRAATMAQFGKRSITAFEDPESLRDLNFDGLMKLLSMMKKILFVSFKRNTLNRTYCSQFIRVPILCLLHTDHGLFSLAPFKVRMEMRELMLTMCKKGLWDEDLDALGQLNHYQDPVFQNIKNQETFQTIYLRLLEHVAISKAPNLDNQIRDNFVSNFLKQPENLEHVFPRLVEEGSKIYVIFSRRMHPQNSFKMDLEALDESLLATPIKDTYEADRPRSATEYMIRSLDLMNSLSLINDSTWDLMTVRYYNYDILTKAISILRNSPNHREIRLSMGEIINSVHQKFFGLPFFKLPKKLQVLGEDQVMLKVLNDTNSFITKAVETSLSVSEVAYMRSQGIMGIIDPLKALITSDTDTSEVKRFMEASTSIENLEESRVVLEEIEKVLETSMDIELDFLRTAQQVVLKLIKAAVEQKKKTYYDFINQALVVFSTIEHKIAGYAATDIVGSLKSSHLLSRRNSYYEPAQNVNIDEDHDLSPVVTSRASSLKKPASRLEMGLIAKDGAPTAGVANAIGAFYSDWKTGKKTLGDKVLGATIDDIERSYKESDAGEVVNTLLDISLLNDDQLLSGVIAQLKRIASYESVLYTELNKLSIVHDPITMARVQDIIKTTFRLNELNREIFFCENNQLLIEDPQMKTCLREVLDHLWKIFFAIYDPSKHFRYPDNRINSAERFQRAFVNTKHLQNDACFKINPKAVNKPFQRIFNIVRANKTLLRTLKWLLEIKHRMEERTYAIRLIIITLSVFLSGNVEHQQLFSGMNEFIRLFYDQEFISQSPDTLSLFGEMMKGNKRLQKLPVKHLYDIIRSTVISTISRPINNSETNGYLTAAIMCYDLLSKCAVPKEIFNSFDILREKWEMISTVEDFTYLNIMGYQGDIITLPHCYYSIKETMEATLQAVGTFVEDLDQTVDMRIVLNFQTWLSFFLSKNYLLQYELKNLVTQCISQIYFTFGKKGKFVHKFDDCAAIVSVLMAEILFFRKYTDTKDNNQSIALRQILDTQSFVTNHEQYNNVKTLYSNIEQLISLERKRLQIGFEDISIYTLFSEYIYGGCLDLLFNLALQEVDYFTELVDNRPDRRTLMDFTLLVFDEFIESEGPKEDFPYQKFEKFLNEASVTKGYGRYKNKIISLANKINSQGAKGYHVQRMILTLNARATETTPLEAFEKHLEGLKQSKRRLKEQNIQDLAECISKHSDPNAVIKQIVTYLKKDQSKLNVEEIKFILKLLRKYIERENPSSLNEPIYKWKNVNISCLKKINKIQRTYKELGLTETLYSLLYSTDPKIFRETLMLSLAYLYGGNSEIQQEFYDNFTDDDENEIMDGLANRLSNAYAIFRSKESDRMYYLYGKVQKNVFDALKTRNSINEISTRQLQTSAFDNNVDTKYLEYAENDLVNHNFILILTFLQSLCEKQFTQMQLFLKEQSYNGRVYPKSFDFIGFLRQCINSYHKVLNKYNLTIGSKILELITELIQGDVTSNISVFLNKTFIYDMCRIVTDYNTRYHTLPRGFGLNPFYPSFREIKSQVIFVFKTMLENRNEENLNVMTEHLDTAGLMKSFEQLMLNFIHKKNLSIYVTDPTKFVMSLSNEDFKDTLGDAINIYIIYRYLWDDPSTFNDKMRELINGMDKDMQDLLGRLVFTVFRRLASSIEIIIESKEESLLRVWYPVIAVCNYLNEDTQKNFLNTVERDNSQTKISALVNAVQEFMPQMYTDYNARQRLFGLNFRNFYYICRFLTNTIALLITIINVGTFQLNADSAVVQDTDFAITVQVFGIIQIILAVILVIMWLLFFRNRHQSLVWERYVEENVKELGPLPPTIQSKVDDGNYDQLDDSDCKFILKLKGANSDEFQDVMEHPASRAKIQSEYTWLNLYFGIKSKTLVWHAIYLGITIGGLFHPIVAVFEIFDIAIRSDSVKQISGAVSKNAKQFLWTLFLLVLTTVVYSSVGFFLLNSEFKDGEDPLCDTAFSCFMNVMNLGLRAGGGIADVIGPQPYSSGDVGLFVVRALFDLSFFIIVITLLLNLIFGMIIDAFGELRDKKSDNDEDQANVCFICGLERSEFERHTNFEDHLSDEHNIWSYIYYIVYLKDRQETSKVEMTDIENLVLEKYQEKDFDWFPVGKSLTLERIYQQEKVSMDNETEKLMKKLESVQKSVNDNVSWVRSTAEQILNLVKK